MQIAPVRKFRTWPGSRICALAGTDGQCLQKRLISPGYGHSFLPWLEPVAISAGQEIQVELHADLVGGDYIWRWETKICGVDYHFQQSALEGTQFSPQWLQRATRWILSPCSPKQGRRSADSSKPWMEMHPCRRSRRRQRSVFRTFFGGRKRRFGAPRSWRRSSPDSRSDCGW